MSDMIRDPDTGCFTKSIDTALREIAESCVDGITWQDGMRNGGLWDLTGDANKFARQEVYGGDEQWTHYVCCQVYGSSAGPDIGTILADDMGLSDEQRSDWDYADDLMDECNNLLEAPDDCVAAFVTMDDNCLWAIWLFDGDPTEAPDA
jgi:hypothetical protein